MTLLSLSLLADRNIFKSPLSSEAMFYGFSCKSFTTKRKSVFLLRSLELLMQQPLQQPSLGQRDTSCCWSWWEESKVHCIGKGHSFASSPH